MLPNRKKRTAAVMLGCGWSSQPQPTASKKECTCPRHSGRKEKSKEEKAEMRSDLLGAWCCSAFGGSRVPGDAFTFCSVKGKWITFCCGCQREIPVQWVFSSQERDAMAKEGVEYKQMVQLNQEWVKLKLDAAAGKL